MKIYQLVESVSSAADLKTAFDNTEWAKIFLHFAGERNLNLGSSDTAIRASLERTFKDIGPGIDDAMMPEDWNARAARFGAALPSASGSSWPLIYNHLAAHRRANVPERYSAFDINRPIGSQLTGYAADTDKTEENLQQVSTWVQAPAQLNREQTRQYFLDWMTALSRNRNRQWMDKLMQAPPGQTIANSSLRSLYRIQEQLIPQGEATVAKSEIDRELYTWLTSADYRFAN